MAEGKLSSETQYLFGAFFFALVCFWVCVSTSIHPSIHPHAGLSPCRPTHPPLTPNPKTPNPNQTGNHFGPAWEAFLGQYERPPCRTCQVRFLRIAVASLEPGRPTRPAPSRSSTIPEPCTYMSSRDAHTHPSPPQPTPNKYTYI